jgi:hypothetical protein
LLHEDRGTGLQILGKRILIDEQIVILKTVFFRRVSRIFFVRHPIYPQPNPEKPTHEPISMHHFRYGTYRNGDMQFAFSVCPSLQ